MSNYYTYLTRHTSTDSDIEGHQRIYLLPTASPPSEDDVLVYAPIALSGLTPEQAAGASEAWVSRSMHNHHHGHRSRIRLPIDPKEGLLAKMA